MADFTTNGLEISRSLDGGVYFYRLQARPPGDGQAGDFVQTKKLLLLK